VSGTFCAKHPKGEFLAKGTGHLFPARSLATRAGQMACENFIPRDVRAPERFLPLRLP